LPQLCNCSPACPTPCVACVSSCLVAASGPSALGGGHLARPEPALSDLPPAVPARCPPHAHTPVRTPSSPDAHLLPHAVLRSMQVADPPGSQLVPSPRPAHPTSSAVCSRLRCGILACYRVLRTSRSGAQGYEACVLLYLREKPRVPTGEAPCTYGRNPPCTYGRNPPCTYGRSPVYLREKPRVPTGEETQSNLLFLKGLTSMDL
jgi:hypothetical protein